MSISLYDFNKSPEIIILRPILNQKHAILILRGHYITVSTKKKKIQKCNICNLL